jgi:beta-glucosidase
VEADVSNKGSRPGEKVVQIYIGLRGTSSAPNVRAWKGFQRIAPAPGDKKTAEFDMPPEAFAI